MSLDAAATTTTILDGLDVVVYVADMHTHEILFANRQATALLGDVVGHRCWEVFQRQPCAFCNKARLVGCGTGCDTVVWDQYSAGDGRWYERRNQALRWIDGRMVCLEMAIDRTRAKQIERALQESEERFRRLAEATSEALLVHDDEAVRDGNSLLERLTGFNRDDLIGMAVLDLFEPGQRGEVAERLSGGDAGPFETAIRARDGHVVPVEVRGHGSLFEDRRVRVTTLRDLSWQKEQERALSETEARMRAVIETTVDGIITIDEEGTIEVANPAAEAIFGFGRGEMVGCSIAAFMPEPEAGQHRDYIRRYLATGKRRIPDSGREMMARRRDGMVFPIHLGVSEVRLDGRRLFTGIVRDLTKLKQLTDRLSYLAQYDPLTDLPNRATLCERLAEIIARSADTGRHVAVAIIGLAGLGRINDTHGHDAINAVLGEAAMRLRSGLPAAALAARVDTDEFAAVFPEAETVEAVTAQVRRVHEAMSAPVRLGEAAVPVVCRVGVALFPRDGTTAEALLRHAEVAVHAVEHRTGDGIAFFDPSLTVSAAERSALTLALSRALAENQFELHYQPQIGLGSRQIVGVEALLRWRHPELGMVPPDKFIPLAEESGMIVAIGDWVIQTACHQAAEWLAAGLPPVRVGVNISARQLAHGDLARTVGEAIEVSGIDAHNLELEMTESMLIVDIAKTLRVLRELKALGVGLAIDDFGTGYSSLAYLRQFAVDRLKIDRAFVKDLHQNEEDRLIVAAIISLAHSLGMTTIAEGVELSSQVDTLADYGCEEIQGYFFGRPMPAAQYAAFAASYGDQPTPSAAEPTLRQRASFQGASAFAGSFKRHISWKRSMSVDVVSIDRQHEDLVDAINVLFDMVLSRANQDACLAHLDRIIDKTRAHFAHEERIMRNIGFHNFANHRQKHEWLLHDIRRFRDSFQQVEDDEAFLHFYTFLKYWLLRHLINEDRRIRDFMHGKVGAAEA